MIINIGDIIYWEGIPHKVKGFEKTVVEIQNTLVSSPRIYFERFVIEDNIRIRPKFSYMSRDSYMHDTIIKTFFKIDNKIVPLSMARDIRIEEILND